MTEMLWFAPARVGLRRPHGGASRTARRDEPRPARRWTCPAPPSHAFTLLELLGVIAIIAVLVGLLLPGLSGARSCARRVVCLSNQRQIATSTYHYAHDSQDWIPREGTREPGRFATPARIPLWIALRPLLQPDHDWSPYASDGFDLVPCFRDPVNRTAHPIHYVVNGYPFLAPGVIDNRAYRDHRKRRGPTQLFRHASPARTLYLADLAEDESGALLAGWIPLFTSDIDTAQYYDAWWPAHLDALDAARRIALTNHGAGGSVVTFLDGHSASSRADFIADANSWDDLLY
jgi:type II secretory pathway pseudopilin PulG